ncbi:hypothetical protein [Acetobacter fallax]|nr:hypothetical protein [Acetobacter fallax]NHO37917.1 hypothetical protein [Acetobacter fallax]
MRPAQDLSAIAKIGQLAAGMLRIDLIPRYETGIAVEGGQIKVEDFHPHGFWQPEKTVLPRIQRLRHGRDQDFPYQPVDQAARLLNQQGLKCRGNLRDTPADPVQFFIQIPYRLTTIFVSQTEERESAEARKNNIRSPAGQVNSRHTIVLYFARFICWNNVAF